MTLKLHDSKTRKTTPFEPVNPGQVCIYVCGATVQGSPHIGHMRSALAFDVAVRWFLRSGYKVTYVRNVTDIDDKILTKSQEEGQPWWAHAYKYEQEFAKAYRDLGTLTPTYEPHATAHIPDQIALVQRLIDAGHAYSDGHGSVYFDVHSLKDYGSLTHQRLEDLSTTEDESQIDQEVEAGKRDPRDFALWKAAKDSEPETAKWDSPWGKGRPGWHLECSAMSRRYLGDEFDIHAGGIDLRFPHHENEQAQSHGAGYGFARRWMHNAWVTIKGEKMSKSLGNSLIVQNILEQYPAVLVRFTLGTVHYRSTVEYSEESLQAADAVWQKLAGFVARAQKALGGDVLEGVEAPSWDQVWRHWYKPESSSAKLQSIPVTDAFAQALDDDLNVAGALAAVHEQVREGNAALQNGDKERLRQIVLSVRAMLDTLGLDPAGDQWGGAQAEDSQQGALDALVQELISQRAKARAEKDWASADAIRDQLKAAGIVVEDGADGAHWHLA
ncbi:cysteine--tRNA ligase [Winkia neuii]|uniref:cysteine--tRNA ligase n=1 Tax=Winkia neuii TaxID=33007 RepID=UPI0007644365|nr:cysteine--tRNA ligase [Winkia neuii]